MFSLSNTHSPWKGSQSDWKNGCTPKAKPGLAVDTSFARHRGQSPQQVFPYKSRTQDLSFVGVDDVKKARVACKPSFKQQWENRLAFRPAAQKAVSESTRARAGAGSRKSEVPSIAQDRTPDLASGHTPPVHRRIRGLRPSPLDLHPDVSPSDRAITIGISIPSAALLRHNASPPLYLPLPTPTIFITPAKGDFDFNLSPEDARHANSYRPASSVYSRYTTCAPLENTPPVPPLPLDGESTMQDPRARGLTRSMSQSTLPSPPRSGGWWNFITSPFSASSKSHAFFWRSSSLPEEDEDRQPITRDVSEMGRSGLHDGVVFTNRTSGDEALRSAPPVGTTSREHFSLKRSDTAPGAYCNGEYAVNIYRIPSQGEAAAYYNPNRHFPSLILEPTGLGLNRDAPDGWSPSHSVYLPEKERHVSTGSSVILGEGVTSTTHSKLPGDEIMDDGRTSQEQARGVALSPFSDIHEDQAPLPGGEQRNVFSTPSEAELASPPTTPSNAHKSMHPAFASDFSPQAETPVVEDAHQATVVGPNTATSNLRQVEVMPARTPTPSAGPGLGAATMAHREVCVPETGWSEKPASEPMHTRNGSRGLGIYDDERVLMPDAPPLVKRPTLGVDRFGQLEVRSFDEKKGPGGPWYRRFFWPLVTTGALLLILAVVGMVVFLPQNHDDMPVEAQWVNTTGFPPLPTGIMTVIAPNAVDEVDGCVTPQALWSCTPPNGRQGGDRPNFRLEIRFRNGTVPSNETALVRRSGTAARAGSFVRRDAWSSSRFIPNPSPPSLNDQLFLGETTDNITVSYDGEETPFYLSVLDASQLVARSLDKRQSDANPYPYPATTTSNSSTATSTPTRSNRGAKITAPTTIPAPALLSNGEAAPALLYPFATAQPLRLYDRGQSSEHYGFYTYFDRRVLVANLSSSTSPGLNPNITSNVEANNATAVCTFSQTRLHVQLWTQRANVTGLGTAIPLAGLKAVNSTANDMQAPGSFPYAVTITLDRHGGQADLKGVYCYGIDGGHHVVGSAKTWVVEDRAFQGQLVNAAGLPGGNGMQAARRDNGAGDGGGVDGGTGGCRCAWSNWT